MQTSIFFADYFLLVIALTTGLVKYRRLDAAFRAVVLLLLVTSVSELSAYIAVSTGKLFAKNVIYQLYAVFQIILITQFFLNSFKVRHRNKLMIINMIVWPVVAALNIVFLQPLDGLNTNMLLAESLSVITMSLYLIYYTLKTDQEGNIFANSHCMLAGLWLVLWSSTFFFWAFIKILYHNNWPYLDLAISIQTLINMIVYTGTAIILFCYPKNKIA